MTQAVSARGITLEVDLDGEWRKFWEVKAVPEVGESADQIDVTSLDSEIKESIKDIPGYASELAFTMNAIPKGAEGSNLDLVMEMSKNATYRWRITYPQVNHRFTFNAQWTWRMGAGAVSSPQDLIIVLIPKSAPVSSKVTETFTITYEANGGTGSTDDTREYAIGDTATIMECGFTFDGHTFSNWNTRADNSGESFDESETVTVFEDMVLYAIWSE